MIAANFLSLAHCPQPGSTTDLARAPTLETSGCFLGGGGGGGTGLFFSAASLSLLSLSSSSCCFFNSRFLCFVSFSSSNLWISALRTFSSSSSLTSL
ncbi:hypothetical protein LKM2_31 [Leptospira kirschneri serovar Mozdok]|nr:hypothetical protein [Leptospira kirschneri serovar Mozdok]